MQEKKVLLPLWVTLLAVAATVVSLAYFIPIDDQSGAGLLRFFGRFHVVVLHLPIVLLLIAPGLEILSKFKKYQSLSSFVLMAWGVAAASTVVTVILGLLLASNEGYSAAIVQEHRFAGTILVLLSLLAFGLKSVSQNSANLLGHTKRLNQAYYAVSLVVVCVLFVTAHAGGSIVRGDAYLAAHAPSPLQKLLGYKNQEKPIVWDKDKHPKYLNEIQPLMGRYCYECHGERIQKAGVRLDTLNPDLMEGRNANHWKAVAKVLSGGEMPPEEKPQPSSLHRSAILDWVNNQLQLADKAGYGDPDKIDIASLKLKSLDPQIVSFVDHYCRECHNDFVKKGDRNFLTFLNDPEHQDNHHVLEEIVNVLNLGKMPQQKPGVKQPAAEKRRAVVKSITQYLSDKLVSTHPVETPLRRLTKNEYINTLREVLVVEPVTSGAIAKFPAEANKHGFKNLGEAQNLSQYQLGLYFEAARENLDRALVFGKEKPQKRTWAFTPSDYHDVDEQNNNRVFYRVYAENKTALDIAHGELEERWPNYPLSFVEQGGAPANGTYRIKVTASGINRLDHPYDMNVLKHDFTSQMQLGIGHAPSRNDLTETSMAARELVEVFDLNDNKKTELEVTAWMKKGSIPYIHWVNGPGSSRGFLKRVIRKYYPQARRFNDATRRAAKRQGKPDPQKIFISDLYKGPRVRVYHFEIEGPLEEQWPPSSHVNLVGKSLQVDDIDIKQALVNFAPKAFRRPVDEKEITHYINYVTEKIANGMAKDEALKFGLSAMLSSPRFLFLDEGNADKRKQLDEYELAARLSYMFWSSPPDAVLLKAASSGTLSQSEELAKQVRRLLADDRATTFAKQFINTWLRLDKIGSMPPAKKQFFAYYRDRLESAMKKETELFFNYILDTNQSILDFIGANYTFVNESLAKHYNIEGVKGETFRKVDISQIKTRRGLLGHASVLTATANGVETSPVLRGVWVLENLLGTPPSPPPPDVPAIEPDTRGATTIREQLDKHRNVAACADCHASIDPWGFALENFDPIGGYRSHYPLPKRSKAERKKPDLRIPLDIDLSGELPNGQHIASISDFHQALADRSDLFSRNLAKNLLIYGTGREPTFRDEEELLAIVSALKDKGYGLVDLIQMVVASNYFQSR